MPYTLKITDEFLGIEWYGVLTPQDLTAIGQDLPRIGRNLGHALHVLHTFDAVTRIDFDPLAAYHHTIRREDIHIPQAVKSAAVAKTPEVFAMARMMQELNRNPMIEMRVFDADADALAWICGP